MSPLLLLGVFWTKRVENVFVGVASTLARGETRLPSACALSVRIPKKMIKIPIPTTTQRIKEIERVGEV
jgi:hypothetical protein